ELEVGRLPPRRVAQHLVAHRDGVVVETLLGVLVDGLIVVVCRLRGISHLEIQVADAIEDGEIGVRIPVLLLSLENVLPRLDGPLRVLGLEAPGLLLLLLKLCHGALKIRAPPEADKRNLLSRRRLRAVPPSSMRLPASPTRSSTRGPLETPTRSGPDPPRGRAPPPR